MSALEDLVPPLDLCKQIPEGKFENSALVWTFDDRLMPRTIMIDGVRHYYRGFPAPTLQEILAELKDEEAFVLFGKHKNDRKWHAYCNYPDGRVDSRIPAEDRDNPATAVLKLWLELNKKGGEQ